MKKLVLVAAVTIASASAYASKARMDALQSAAHLSDTVDILTKPDQAVVLPEFATVYLGTTAGANPNAEGGFIRKMDGAAWGLYLGNRTVSAQTYRSTANGATFSKAFLGLENPLNLIYAMDMGDMRFGGGLYYTSSNKKTGTTNKENKQDASGLYLSASSTAGWDAQLAVGIANNASYTVVAGDVENKMKGNSTAALSGGYLMDTMYLYGSYTMTGAKIEQASTTLFDRKDTTLKIGVVNSHKKDGTDFFYGIAAQMDTQKDDADYAKNTASSIGTSTDRITKRETTSLPAIIGLEHEAMSWLTIRGSLTQNVLYSSQKNSSDVTTADGTNTIDANTTASAGLGLKFGKLTFDGVLQGAQTGDFGSDTKFLAKGAMTYYF